MTVIEDYLARTNRKVSVAGRVATEDSGELVVLFRPTKMPPSVAEVRFVGNSVIPTTTLQNAVTGAAVGFVYREKRFREQLELALRPLYEARGYVRVAFPKIETTPAPDVNGLITTVTVEEGAAYKLEKVDVTGGPIEARKLLDVGDFKTNETFDVKAIDVGKDKILRLLRKDGYIRAKLTYARKIDDTKKALVLTLVLEPGPQYKFRNLVLKGLDINSEPVIRKLWALKPGSPFQRRLSRLLRATHTRGRHLR